MQSHQATAASAPTTIKAVENGADLDAFIRVPWALHGEDPAWIPPLLQERRDFLNPRKNPFFDTSEARFWLARRDGRNVGRISAQVNRAHLDRHKDSTGHFGLLESDDRPETFQALFTAAETWLKQQGLTRVVGPFSLSINEESGLLVDGFQHPPSLMMGHAQPYYSVQLEALGYRKIKDLICYRYSTDHVLPEPIARLVDKLSKAENITIRPLNMRRYEEDLGKIIGIFNDAWSENWGFVPLSQAEIGALARDLKPILRPDSVAIAEMGGEAVAMAICLPNVNEAITDLNGRLLPFGWAKLLWRLKVGTPKTARLPLMGVRRAYHATPLGAALAFAVIESLRRTQLRLGVESVELSWILEDNQPMRRMIDRFGGVAYKTYRLYSRELG